MWSGDDLAVNGGSADAEVCGDAFDGEAVGVELAAEPLFVWGYDGGSASASALLACGLEAGVGAFADEFSFELGVGGHEILPVGGQRTSPVADTKAPRGHQISPVLSIVLVTVVVNE